MLFALYPRFYVIKSAYANNEYRFLITQGSLKMYPSKAMI
ncbi:hypothetical protein GCWU000324_03157 [Kingella oralis ATCC 51147]|uniref:Uncharacterized protein n=1 Tax=Kingella oralis ATCC 51147 TaxID=629741 RepID=C4GN68_9NEIS|nr:hypothetical protein GCWU000324_03157 [Kingella oralis ATCC 51147]